MNRQHESKCSSEIETRKICIYHLIQALVFLALVMFTTSAFAGSASLEWSPSDPGGVGVAGYKVYSGTSSGIYNGYEDVGNTTSYTVNNLQDGLWYFTVTAYSAGGLESGYANEVSKVIEDAGGLVLINTVADISVNGSDGPVTVLQGDNVNVQVSLAAGILTGEAAELWVKVFVHDAASGIFTPINLFEQQTPLTDIAPVTLINSTLSEGIYIFYFGADLVQNGQMDMESMYYDAVVVHVRADILEGIQPSSGVKISGQDAPVTLAATDEVSLQLELDAGSYGGYMADLWLKAYIYSNDNGFLIPLNLTGGAIELAGMDPVSVLNSRINSGFYMFLFGVDMQQDGAFDSEQLYFDSGFVNVK